MRVEPLHPDPMRLVSREIRRTAASLAISVGANVKAVQKMFGYASAGMTLDVDDDLFDDDLDAVGEALGAAGDPEATVRSSARGDCPASVRGPHEIAERD